jgi:hypothetical protein
MPAEPSQSDLQEYLDAADAAYFRGVPSDSGNLVFHGRLLCSIRD